MCEVLNKHKDDAPLYAKAVEHAAKVLSPAKSSKGLKASFGMDGDGASSGSITKPVQSPNGSAKYCVSPSTDAPSPAISPSKSPKADENAVSPLKGWLPASPAPPPPPPPVTVDGDKDSEDDDVHTEELPAARVVGGIGSGAGVTPKLEAWLKEREQAFEERTRAMLREELTRQFAEFAAEMRSTTSSTPVQSTDL